MGEQTASIREQIREFVVTKMAQSKGVTVTSDTASLTDLGIIDSLGIFRLVAFLEETFPLQIADEDIVHENFSSIEAIEKFVVQHSKK